MRKRCQDQDTETNIIQDQDPEGKALGVDDQTCWQWHIWKCHHLVMLTREHVNNFQRIQTTTHPEFNSDGCPGGIVKSTAPPSFLSLSMYR
jgi:hypothetical protein